MADNVILDSMSGGDTIAADDIGGVKYQRVKIALGGDGTFSGDMAAGAGAVGTTTPRFTLASDDPAVTSLAVLDDWDESDRAKVNIIVGQAGVAAGSGTIGATTQRVTIATDDTVATDLTAIKTAIQILDNVVSGSEAQVDVVGALPAGTNDIGRVGHNITGIGHGVTTVTTAGTDVALAASTACKRVIIQAQTDNTSTIAVGASGVDATIATGNGIVLYPGDSIEIEIDNLNDIYIDSLVNGEGVRYTYFT